MSVLDGTLIKDGETWVKQAFSNQQQVKDADIDYTTKASSEEGNNHRAKQNRHVCWLSILYMHMK